ncbi:MAG: hypothetical protein U0974_13740 [Gemmatimonadales bacterium]|nr:hypothetical protein [Gemmatimonadales bacterium]MDZ4390776.1 hypothetical protein [Gemmatimonadales bacterium]
MLRLKRIATAIGELTDEVVFIGGAVSPLLQEQPPFDQARITKDVDGIIVTPSYTAMSGIGERLLALGFNHSTTTGHVHRWISTDGDLLDLVPSGQHLGASGQEWDEYAARDDVKVDLGDGVTIRHASSATFLALKWAAFKDRGANDPGASHDLEDIVAIVVSRPGIVEEVHAAPEKVRGFITDSTGQFLLHPRAEDYLAGCVNRAQDPSFTLTQALLRLGRIRDW